LASSLVAAKNFVTVVNQSQVRDLVKAMGTLAKADAIDAKVLADFAEEIRPPGQRPARRGCSAVRGAADPPWQLLEMRSAEKNRFEAASAPRFLKDLRACVRYLDRRVEEMDGELR
jgi:transposase